MIDNMCAKIEGFKQSEWNRFRNSIEEANFTKKSNGLRVYLDWSNLRITYLPNRKEVWIKNSLHKFFNHLVNDVPISSCNYNDFTFANLKKTLEFISYHFNRSLNDFKFFGEFEFGVNINVNPYKTIDIIESYLCISNTGSNIFYPMHPKKGRIYGKKCYFTEYNFKVYDKSKQAETLERGIMRLECQSETYRIKKRLDIKDFTFHNVIEEKYIKFLKDEFFTFYNSIMKIPINQSMDREELKEILMISSPQGRSLDKTEMTTYHYRENRKKQKSIMREYSDDPNSVHYFVKSQIEKKMRILTS